MKSKIHILLFSAFVFFITSCSSEKQNGIPCTYDISKSPATVIAVQQIDTRPVYEILFSVQKNGKTDTVRYTQEFPGYATDDDVKKYNLKVGNQFVYEHQVKIKGDCTPEIYTLKMEKY
jgi:hypothetical protein